MTEPMNPTVIWKFLTPKVRKFWNVQAKGHKVNQYLEKFLLMNFRIGEGPFIYYVSTFSGFSKNSLVLFLFFKGFHQRTIQLKDLKPSGICLVDGKLYLADVLKKKIVCFNITDT